MSFNLHQSFPALPTLDDRVEARCVTPAFPGCIHRFFDTSPFSPSGRRLAATRVPFDDRTPQPGDVAEIVVVDLESGEQRVVAETRGWEMQLGAQVNWGPDDDTLYFNDVDPTTWTPHAVRSNLVDGRRERLAGTLYHADPQGRWLASCDLASMRRTQPGYGVVLPESHTPRRVGLSDDAGLWLTDGLADPRSAEGQPKLLVSIKQLVDAAGPSELRESPERFEVYAFHCKWTPRGDRLLVTLRWFPVGAACDRDAFAAQGADTFRVRFAVYTLKPDGTDVALAVGPEHWARGGHHINFTPDSSALSMNLRLPDEDDVSLCLVDVDGTNLRAVAPGCPGSGHPTVHPGGMWLTDTYTNETRFADAEAQVPLRWIDPRTGHEDRPMWVPTDRVHPGGPLRLDPHPAWDRTWQRVAVNAWIGGQRHVAVVNFGALLR